MDTNPFKFGDPVEGAYYLPRKELETTVSQFLKNRVHVVLIGPRRFGKTSFVLNLLKSFENKEQTTLFIDIFNITSHRDFLQQMMRALKPKKNWSQALKDWLDALPSIKPKVSAEIDSYTGQSTLGLTLDKASEKDVKELIQDVFVSLSKLNKHVIVAIDEFQQIAEINDQGWLEATLRTNMQQLKNVSFLLTGSRKSLIYDMLNNHSRPLYRSCQPIEFPSLGPEFSSWVVDKFASIDIQCDIQAIDHLRKLVQDTPNYVQMVCFHLVAQGKKQIRLEDVEIALSQVVKQNSYTYQVILSSLTLPQQRALRLAAHEPNNVFSQELLDRYEITSAPALASSLKALKEKGLLDEEGTHRGAVVFDDPLFALWLRQI